MGKCENLLKRLHHPTQATKHCHYSVQTHRAILTAELTLLEIITASFSLFSPLFAFIILLFTTGEFSGAC